MYYVCINNIEWFVLFCPNIWDSTFRPHPFLRPNSTNSYQSHHTNSLYGKSDALQHLSARQINMVKKKRCFSSVNEHVINIPTVRIVIDRVYLSRLSETEVFCRTRQIYSKSGLRRPVL